MKRFALPLLALCLLAIAPTTTFAADIPAFCEGTQTGRDNRAVDVKYWFQEKRAEFENKWANASAKGRLSEVSFDGKKLSYVVTYDGGKAHGTSAHYTLTRAADSFSGTGANRSMGTNFDVKLVCK